jgi:lipopolysaccharide assembly protein A
VEDKPRVIDETSDVTGTGTATRSRISGLWVGLVLSAVVLVFLLVFILQNGAPVQIAFLGWTGALPTGVALLFAAVAGVLLVAIPGSVRMLQLRRAASGDRARPAGPRSRG